MSQDPESAGEPEPKAAPLSVRSTASRKTVRRSLLKPILNIARFFVGDTIPRLPDAASVGASIREFQEAGIPVSESDKGLLNKVIVQMLKAEKDPQQGELFRAYGLLSGLLLYCIQDEYFFIPEVSEHASPDKVEWLAQKLEEAHTKRVQALGRLRVQFGLRFRGAADLDGLLETLPESARTEEMAAILTKIRVHLGQGEAILARHTDKEREEAHRDRYRSALERAANLIARLTAVPPDKDHNKLRRRIKVRELRAIEVDALGAQLITEYEQQEQAKALLDQTGQDLGQAVSEESRDDVAAQLQALQAEAEQADAEESEDADWFFDME